MKTLFLLCCIIALSNALPRSKYGYYLDSEGYAHPDPPRLDDREVNRLSSSAMAHSNGIIIPTPRDPIKQCQSAINGDTYVHVCKNTKTNKFCYTSNTQRCCETRPGTEIDIVRIEFHDKYHANLIFRRSPLTSTGLCFFLRPLFGDPAIEPCSQCVRERDTCVVTACFENTRRGDESGCGANGDQCECRIGYSEPDCCTCAPRYFLHPIRQRCEANCRQCVVTRNGTCGSCTDNFALPGCCNCLDNHVKEEGVCKPICRENVVRGSCTETECECTTGYTGNDCCDCADGYYRNEDGECTKSECPVNVMRCTEGECVCRKGYRRNDCCDCADGYYKNEDGECAEPKCPFNVLRCTEVGCVCRNGYQQNDCCDCVDGYFQTEDGTCKTGCFENTITGDARSCSSGVCKCKPGYAPPSCCECDIEGVTSGSGQRYYRDPRTDQCLSVCENCVSPTIDGRCRSCRNGLALPNCCNCPSGHYLRHGQCVVEPRCPENVVRCTERGCECREGFTGDDCCNCDSGYFRTKDGTCKTGCFENTATGDARSCRSGVCKCKPGYAPPTCCKCDIEGVTSGSGQRYYRDPETDRCLSVCENCVSPTIDGRCRSCRNGFALPSCCNCPSGHYLRHGQCVEPRCSGNVVSCTERGCECREGFTGDDCCIPEPCARKQDLYFLLDTTQSYTLENFCQIQYGLSLVIGALNPTGTKYSRTRIGTFLFPILFGEGKHGKIISELREDPRNSTMYMDTDTPCEKAIEKLEDLILAKYLTIKNVKYPSISLVKGELTFPATAIQTLTDYILDETKKDPTIGNRGRVAVLLTDGDDDGENDDPAQKRAFGTLSGAVANLTTKTNIQIIPVGLDTSAVNRGKLDDTLGKISDSPIVSGNSVDLARLLIRRLQNDGVLCDKNAEDALDKLKNRVSTDFCRCVSKQRPDKDDYHVDRCIRKSQYRFENMCGGPVPQVLPTEDKKDSLEQEILAAVEAVLEDKMRG